VLKKLFIVAFGILVSSCASQVRMQEDSSGYVYDGESYGVVEVSLSDAVTDDLRKVERTEELGLEANIKEQLRAQGIFDENSNNTVRVKIDRIHVRNSFNAVMFGMFSGSDSLDGTVTLDKGTGSDISFSISADYSLGGFGGGRNDARLGWLSKKFAELTAATISGRQ